MAKTRKITKAVIAVAGYGTRFLPVTKSVPKQMIPIIDKPTLQYVVEELVASGIKDVILVTQFGQHAMEDHFDSHYELEKQLEENSQHDLLKGIKEIPEMANFIYLRQTKDYPYGNGSPLLVVKSLIKKNESFVYVFGDDLWKSKIPCTKQLINFWKKHGNAKKVVTAAQDVPRQETCRYGIFKLKKGTDWVVSDLVEKPKVEEAPSTLAQDGRFILNWEIIKILEKRKLGQGNELWLTDALREYAQTNNVLVAKIKGQWFTTGDPLRWLKTNIEFALDREDLKEELEKFLREKLVS